jgi:subtilisin family serine protease
MSTKAIITRRGIARSEAVAATESTEAGTLGLAVEHRLPQGTLVSGTDQQYADLEARGYRVKVLTDTNILEVGSYRIDLEVAPAKVPPKLEVPKALQKSWSHHLVQLAGPREEDWIKAIESQGVDVIEPISAYGLFVVGSPEQVESLKTLPFVAWVGPFKPAYRIHPNLSGRKGTIKYVSIGVYPEAETDVVKATLAKAKAIIVRESSPQEHNGKYMRLVVEVDSKNIPSLASLPGVRWLEYASPEPGLDGERETQIVAENLDNAAAPNTAPVVGYQAWLTGLGLSGAGVRAAICDTGVDAGPNNNATGHLDLRGRQAAFVDYTGGGTTTDTDGHGTHVAGIAIGNAATGQTEAAAPNNFLWGQGMAPQSNYIAQNALMGPWPPANWGNLTQDSINNGAQVQNNSWWDGGPAGSGYTANARRYDQLVRDPNEATAALESLIIVFSAGNAGPNASTITPPKEAKNPITVGNLMTHRPGVAIGPHSTSDDIRGVNRGSSRGPALDGRILPNVVAPGTDVSSCLSEFCGRAAIAGTGTPDPANPANRINQYLYLTGTSMAAPHVTGACALLVEWWRNRTGGRILSPAMAKALLINGAEDLAGGPSGRQNAAGNPIPLTNIPNNDQGWGRVSLENILLQVPASDRGPKIFSDQRHAFTANGQEYTIRVAPVNTGPNTVMRITLVWTDAPGSPATVAGRALVNDLDLEVLQIQADGTILNTYRGNVFLNGFSTPVTDPVNQPFNDRDNIECVYIQNPSGVYEVNVIAQNIGASARPDVTTPWQDFALIIDNAEVPAAAPVSVVPVIDRSGSMVYSGYVNITKTSSKQFIDLMGVMDRLGIVSFGSTAAVEYPTGPAPTLQTLFGQPVRDAAKAEIDGIAFGGCTYMGAGINEAKNLLIPAAGARAMVLLSDGYDNKGCDPANPAKPSALDAVAGLPANMPIYTCAMGPASDQTLLEQIANVTSGRYYYMPNIEDLFEIYNYIRGQVTGDAIVANESSMASSSRVAAFVDTLATEATFTLAWADSKMRYVSGEPKKANEVAVRLRDPRGKLVHANCSYVRRTVGQGYVMFELQEPAAGQWFVEVTTAGETHLRYTVGGFVRSPLRLLVSIKPQQIIAGMPINIAAQVFDGKFPITGFKSNIHVAGPALSIAGLLGKYKAQLKDIQPAKLPGGDTLPSDIGKLVTLRVRILKDKKPDPFAHTVWPVTLRSATIADLQRLRFEHLITPVAPVLPVAPSIPGVLAGRFTYTKQQGSYNVVMTVTGSSPISQTRFVRKMLSSVIVK